jgi:hypothetical protein
MVIGDGCNGRQMAKARGKKDRSRQRELQADIRALRREVRKREVCLNCYCITCVIGGLLVRLR